MVRCFSIVLSLLLLLIAYADVDGDYFGNHYNWKSFDEGMKEIEESSKPGIVIIYKSWCKACRALGKRVANDEKMIEFSSRFVMILARDEDEPQEDMWLPDGHGKYYPRVFFINTDGSIDYDVSNAGFSPIYHYYYYDSENLYDSMILYLESHGLYDRDLTHIETIDNDLETEL